MALGQADIRWRARTVAVCNFTPYLTENTGSVLTDQSNTRTLVFASLASYWSLSLTSIPQVPTESFINLMCG